jgi:hypothetical protein
MILIKRSVMKGREGLRRKWEFLKKRKITENLTGQILRVSSEPCNRVFPKLRNRPEENPIPG